MLKLALVSVVLIFVVSNCTKDRANAVPGTDNIDAELYDMAVNYNDSIWFASVDSLFERSVGSGHGQPFLKVKYNSIAGTVLDSNGRVIQDTIFPEGSLIIKELYDDSTTIGRYAMLYKSVNNIYADDNGWVWGYVNADQSVAAPAKDKGKACINCHNQTGNVNSTLMNKFYP